MRLGEGEDFIATAVKELPKTKTNQIFIIKNHCTPSHSCPPIHGLEGVQSPHTTWCTIRRKQNLDWTS